MKPDLAAIQKAVKKLGNIKNRYVPGCGHEVVTKLGTLAFVDQQTNCAKYLDRDTAEAIFTIPALLAYIEQLEAGRQWVPVTPKTMPPLDKMVLCLTKDNAAITGYYYDGWHTGRFPEHVTHWMRLPPLPEATS